MSGSSDTTPSLDSNILYSVNADRDFTESDLPGCVAQVKATILISMIKCRVILEKKIVVMKMIISALIRRMMTWICQQLIVKTFDGQERQYLNLI